MITISFTTIRRGMFIPMQLTNAHPFVGTIRVPGGAEKGEVKYTSAFMEIVSSSGQGSTFTSVVDRRVTGVRSIVAVAPSTNTASRDVAKQMFVTRVNGLNFFSLVISLRETVLEVFAPLSVMDTGSTVVTNMTSL